MDHTRVARGIMQCPTCAAKELEAVTDGEATNFLCRTCWSCWHLELGWVQKVDPGTCPGCQYREECLSRRTTRPG